MVFNPLMAFPIFNIAPYFCYYQFGIAKKILCLMRRSNIIHTKLILSYIQNIIISISTFNPVQIISGKLRYPYSFVMLCKLFCKSGLAGRFRTGNGNSFDHTSPSRCNFFHSIYPKTASIRKTKYWKLVKTSPFEKYNGTETISPMIQ